MSNLFPHEYTKCNYFSKFKQCKTSLILNNTIFSKPDLCNDFSKPDQCNDFCSPKQSNDNFKLKTMQENLESK